MQWPSRQQFDLLVTRTIQNEELLYTTSDNVGQVQARLANLENSQRPPYSETNLVPLNFVEQGTTLRDVPGRLDTLELEQARHVETKSQSDGGNYSGTLDNASSMFGAYQVSQKVRLRRVQLSTGIWGVIPEMPAELLIFVRRADTQLIVRTGMSYVDNQLRAEIPGGLLMDVGATYLVGIALPSPASWTYDSTAGASYSGVFQGVSTDSVYSSSTPNGSPAEVASAPNGAVLPFEFVYTTP